MFCLPLSWRALLSSEKRLQHLVLRIVSQSSYCLFLYLPYSFPCQSVFGAYLLECFFGLVYAEECFYHFSLPFVQGLQCAFYFFSERFHHEHVVRLRRVVVWHYVDEASVFAFGKWCVHGDVSAVYLHGVSYLVFRQVHSFCYFVDACPSFVFLFEFVEHLVYLVYRAHLVERQSYYSALLCDGLQYALAYPPYGV